MNELTQEGLVSYLERNPEKTFQCGDPTSCVLAQYLVDEVMKAEDYGVPAIAVQVYDGYHAYVYDASKLHQERIGELELPDWAENVVGTFDWMQDYFDDGYEANEARTWFAGDEVLEFLVKEGAL